MLFPSMKLWCGLCVFRYCGPMPFITLQSSLGACGLALFRAFSDAGLTKAEPVGIVERAASLATLAGRVSSTLRRSALGAFHHGPSCPI